MITDPNEIIPLGSTDWDIVQPDMDELRKYLDHKHSSLINHKTIEELSENHADPSVYRG